MSETPVNYIVGQQAILTTAVARLGGGLGVLTHVLLGVDNYGRCIVCEYSNVSATSSCPGPPGWRRNAAEREAAKRIEFAAKIKTISIHPRGR